MMRGTFCDWLINQGVEFHPDTVIIEATSVNEYLMALASSDNSESIKDSKSVGVLFESLKTKVTLPMFGECFLETKTHLGFSIGQYISRRDNSPKHPDGLVYSVATFISDMKSNNGVYCPVAGVHQWTHEGYWNGVVGLEHFSIENLEAVNIDPYWHVLLLSMDWVHQKAEVELVDYPRSFIRRERRMKGKEPSPYFRIIAPGKTVKVNTNPSQGTGNTVKLPLHTVRGHFRHVENHPIEWFNGTFWIPAHTRGDEKLGKLQKHYKIRLPEQDTVAS